MSASENSAAQTMGVQVSHQHFDFLCSHGIADHKAVLFLAFWELPDRLPWCLY